VVRPELERRLAVLVEPLERAVLDGVRELEGEPDRIRVGLGLVPVFLDERPLIGLAGLLDWRSSGRLSAVVRSSFFTGAEGEQLLTPGERRWPSDRLVLLGLGSRAEFDAARARRLGARCVEIATGLAAETVLIALPSGTIERGLLEIAFDSLLASIERSSLATTAKPIEERAEALVERSPESSEVEPNAEPQAEIEALEEPAQAEPVVEPAPESQQPAAEERSALAKPRWWVVADQAVVARLRRVRSGPPRAADAGPSLYT
jgi:hypothetical protein